MERQAVNSLYQSVAKVRHMVRVITDQETYVWSPVLFVPNISLTELTELSPDLSPITAETAKRVKAKAN